MSLPQFHAKKLPWVQADAEYDVASFGPNREVREPLVEGDDPSMAISQRLEKLPSLFAKQVQDAFVEDLEQFAVDVMAINESKKKAISKLRSAVDGTDQAKKQLCTHMCDKLSKLIRGDDGLANIVRQRLGTAVGGTGV